MGTNTCHGQPNRGARIACDNAPSAASEAAYATLASVADSLRPDGACCFGAIGTVSNETDLSFHPPPAPHRLTGRLPESRVSEPAALSAPCRLCQLVEGTWLARLAASESTSFGSDLSFGTEGPASSASLMIRPKPCRGNGGLSASYPAAGHRREDPDTRSASCACPGKMRGKLLQTLRAQVRGDLVVGLLLRVFLRQRWSVRWDVGPRMRGLQRGPFTG